MKHIFTIPNATLLTFLATLHCVHPASAREVPLAFVTQHCADCHAGDAAEGGFRADLLSKELAEPANHKAWSRVLARVQSGEMPPQDTERPAEAEIVAALAALKTAFHETAKARHGEAGRVRVRRLNRLEYENTVRDLLDIDTPLQDLLPEDDLIDGFSNQAAGLSISPVHIQQYMAAADRALDAASVRQARPETKTYRFSYTDDAEQPFHGHAHNKLQCNLRGEDLHFFLDTHIEVPAYLRQFEAVTRDTPGRYRIRITTEARDTTDGEDLIFSVWLAAGNKRRELLGHFDAKRRKESVVELTRPFERGETIIVAPWRMAKVRIDAGYSVYLPDKQEKIPEGWHFAFGDQEEMGFGARVATPLTEKNGGLITSSTGRRSAASTWGQEAAWCDYSGKLGEHPVGITLIPDADNFRASWWHNRDYGVFVANPFGRAAMKQGDKSTVTIPRRQPFRIRFTAVIHEGQNFAPEAELRAIQEARDQSEAGTKKESP